MLLYGPNINLPPYLQEYYPQTQQLLINWLLFWKFGCTSILCRDNIKKNVKYTLNLSIRIILSSVVEERWRWTSRNNNENMLSMTIDESWCTLLYWKHNENKSNNPEMKVQGLRKVSTYLGLNHKKSTTIILKIESWKPHYHSIRPIESTGTKLLIANHANNQQKTTKRYGK